METTNTTMIENYRNDFNTLADILLKANIPHFDHLLGNYSKGLCPELQFIGIEALSHDKIPHNIPQNGCYIYFKIDMQQKSVEVHSSGHIELTKEDMKASYLCMTGLKNLAKFYNVKWFRKQKYKDINDLAKRIINFYTIIMDMVSTHTEGDYKVGKCNIY